jgi:predicted Zn-ribbon and HTH transcriptional regulator
MPKRIGLLTANGRYLKAQRSNGGFIETSNVLKSWEEFRVKVIEPFKKVSLHTVHGTYLSYNKNGVSLVYQCGNTEIWEFEYRYNKKVSFKNSHGQYLCGSKENNFLSDSQNIFTMFQIIDCSPTLYVDPIPYKFYIKSPIGTFLNNDHGIAKLTPKVDYSTMFTASVHLGVMNIQSVDSTYLTFDNGGNVKFAPKPHSFRVCQFPNGTIRIKIMSGKRYVAGNNMHKVFLSPVDRSWEKWTIVPILDKPKEKPTVAPVEDLMECVICNDAPKEVIFIPCGHITACKICGEEIINRSKLCPICKQEIVSMNKFIIC